MSPCSPSRLCLMESQPQYSVQRKRKHHLSELHNNRQLSPVLESNFSDCSASDYRHVVSDTFSPLSSATSGSRSGTFPVGQRGEFKPFSQPRDASPWSAMSHGAHKVRYPPVSRVQFGSTESSFISTQKSRGHATTGCFLRLSKDEENDEETALMDFDSGEYSGQTTTFDNRKIRISFQEETQNSMPFGHPKEFQTRHQEADFLSQPVDSAACGGHGQGSVKSCGSVCSSPCDGLFSSGSDSVGSRGGERDQFVPSLLQPVTSHRAAWTGQENRPFKTRETGTQTDSRNAISLRHTSDASTQCSPRWEGEFSTSPSAGLRYYSCSVSHQKHNRATRGQRVSADELLEMDSHAGTPDRLREEELLPQSKSGVAAQQSPRNALTGQLLSGGPSYWPKTMPENWRLSTPAINHIYLNKTQVREELRKEQTNGGQRQVKQVENFDHLKPDPAEDMSRGEGEDLTTESILKNKDSDETATMQEIADILLMMKQKNKF
ncbi:uncharacterized protein LOC133135847 isoform X1 [Conger conger]|uniref:uncharacterized protein LOC133135847 isoform X1 n=1 Tax=Conger conger TaxID=82655 RepID=UPI002A5AB303|nr:uncharacterized protein LOC133135847 isoform X1 [Conger conger]